MKKNSLILLFICLIFSFTSTLSKAQTAESSDYVVLSEAEFKAIEADLEQQQDYIPILIEGYSKAELVAFYIQSYNEDILATWVDFAFEKIQNFEAVKPSAEQKEQLSAILKLPRNAENSFQFMMLMTTEQIETVGY